MGWAGRARLGPLLAALALLAACTEDPQPSAGGGELGSPSPSPQPSTRTAGPVTIEPEPGSLRPRVVRTVAEGLEVPWGVTFLPDGSALVSERDSGRVLALEDGEVREVGRLGEVSAQGEAGLLGLAASPTFADDGWVYAYVSTDSDNRVVRMQYDGRRLGPTRVVLADIPTGFIHDGGRLLFDDEGMLLVSTGEIGEPGLAQQRGSLAGKILRIRPDGRPAPGNPEPGSRVWTLGHRNVQGLAFDDRGRLWATEFGSDQVDELNLIEAGRNYGWPLVEGVGDLEELRNPFVTWRTDQASPSGLAFHRGSLWAAALRGERLWQIPLTDQGTGEPRAWFVGEFGRMRTVTVTPAGTLWVTTSNRDGRGDPAATDDRILELRVG